MRHPVKTAALIDYLTDLLVEDFECDLGIAELSLTTDNDAHDQSRHLRSLLDGQATRIVDR